MSLSIWTRRNWWHRLNPSSCGCGTGAKRVAIHFDVDVLEPAHYDFLVFRDPSATPDALHGVARGPMRFAQVSEILNADTAEADTVRLAIAEYLPWSVVEFAKALNALAGGVPKWLRMLRALISAVENFASGIPRNDDPPECAPHL